MFNKYFTNIVNELANKINYSGTKDFKYYLRNRQNHTFTLNEVNEQTVTTIIENLPAKKKHRDIKPPVPKINNTNMEKVNNLNFLD